MTKDEFKKLEEEHKKKLEEEYTFLDKKDYMKFEDCKEGFTYNIDGRNFSYGIFHNEQFYGIRHKFGDTFIDTEIHWDKDDHYGTVKPIKELEETPKHIFNMLKYYTDKSYATGIKERLHMAFVVVRHYLEGFIK